MPKETIHTSNYPGDQSFDVKVGWTRNMDVQLGIAEADDRSMWWVYGENYKEIIGAEIRKIMVSDNESLTISEDRQLGESLLNMLDTVCGSFTSLWATMDRQEVNTLIRVLRRARDSAFGKDE